MASHESQNVDVLVIGAGISGLSAALFLHEKGHSVTVLEARNRVGGRTCAFEAEMPDGKKIIVDVGGQWVGPTQTRLKALSKRLGLEEVKQYNEGKTVLGHCGRITTYSGIIPYGIGIAAMLDIQWALYRIDAWAKTVPKEAPWDCPYAKEWDAMTVQTWMDKQFWTAKGKDIFRSAVLAITACEPSEVSFLFFLYYVIAAGGITRLIEFEGGAQEAKFKLGAQNISERLVELIGKEKVILNSPVRKIEQPEGDAWIHVHTDDGTKYSARYVIVAIPPTLAARINYQPILPAKRDHLYQRMPMGYTIKTITFFKTAFWRERGYAGTFTSDQEPISFCVDSCSSEYPALVGFIYANAAREWGAKTREERIEGILQQYATMFGSELSPNNNNNNNQKQQQQQQQQQQFEFLKSHMVTYVEKDWGAEEFSRGAYEAVMSPGCLTSCGPIIREPFGKIHWAGTEAATEWCGYIEGAIQSGERAAAEVCFKLRQ